MPWIVPAVTKLIPGGKAPCEIENEYGAVPPAAVMTIVYMTPTSKFHTPPVGAGGLVVKTRPLIIVPRNKFGIISGGTALSCPVMVKLYEPGTVGVPLTVTVVAVLLLTVRPAGKTLAVNV